LACDHRIVEIDFEVDGQTLAGHQRDPAVRLANRDRFENLQSPPLRRLLLDACVFDQGNEGRCATIHRGHLATMQFNHDIVDATTEKGRHEVLYGGNRDALAIGQSRAERPFDCVLPGCVDLRRLVHYIRTAKSDSGVRRGRMQDHYGVQAGMQSDAGTVN
jgi:hypothetical protein